MRKYYAQPLDVQEKKAVANSTTPPWRKTLWSITDPNDESRRLSVKTTVAVESTRADFRIDVYKSNGGWQEVYRITGKQAEELRKEKNLNKAEQVLLRLYYMVATADPSCVVLVDSYKPDRAASDVDDPGLARFAAMDTE